MSAVEDALRHWWEKDSPAVRAKLRRFYRTRPFDDPMTRFLHAVAGEAFRAGWRARERMKEAQGTQPGLFGTPSPDE